MTASEKVAYLKGLAEGLGIDGETSEGKLMLAMIDVLDSLADDVEDLEATAADLADSIDDIGEDMSQSPSNFLRDVVSTAAVVGLAPVSVVLMLI